MPTRGWLVQQNRPIGRTGADKSLSAIRWPIGPTSARLFHSGRLRRSSSTCKSAHRALVQLLCSCVCASGLRTGGALRICDHIRICTRRASFVAALGCLAGRRRQSEKGSFSRPGKGTGSLAGLFTGCDREVAGAEAAPVAWALCGGSGAGATRLVPQTEAGTSICHGGECVCARRNGRNTHAMLRGKRPCIPRDRQPREESGGK
jgi:hypothetical protein